MALNHPTLSLFLGSRLCLKKRERLSDSMVEIQIQSHYWYNYLYSEQELRPWVEKVKQIREQTKIISVYFNNHYGGKAVVNAMQFKEMNSMSLSTEEKRVLDRAQTRISI